MTEENEVIEPEDVDPEPVSMSIAPFDAGTSDALVFNSDEDMKVALERATRRITFIDDMIKLVMKKLLPTDFHDFGGKPVLQGVGAQRFIKFFGISVRNIRRIPAKGYEIIGEDTAKRLRITYRGDFYFPGTNVPIEGEGIRDSHNNFFCKTDEDYKEIADIELPNLDRAARTAMYRDGITTMFGLKGVSWDYLKGLGFTPDNTTGHSYQKGSKGGSVAGDDPETKRMLKEIGDMCMEMADGDPDTAANILETLTFYNGKGKRELSKLTAPQTPVIHGKCKKKYEEFMRKRAEEESEPKENTKTREATQEDIPF